MRIRQLLATLAAGALLAGAGIATASPASASVTIDGVSGRTQVTTAPGLAGYLLGKGILPYSVSPGGTDKVRWTPRSGLQLTYGFPVTSLSTDPVDGTLAGAVLGAQIGHSGGLAFVNLHRFTRVKISDFTIDVPRGKLVATLTGFAGVPNGTRADVFDLAIDPGKATIVAGQPIVVPGVVVKLAPGVAALLNASLKTTAFPEGVTIGTAKATVVLPS